MLVATGEALLDRRLAEIPAAEWSDIAVDITPREYVLDYLAHSFPTPLFEVFSDAEGNLMSRPLFDADGNPVVSREAAERSEERRVGKECVSPCRSRWGPYRHKKKK